MAHRLKVPAVFLCLLVGCGSAELAGDGIPANTKFSGAPISANHRANMGPLLGAKSNSIPVEWQKISAYGFSFFLPPDAVERNVQGIDSYVGSYRASSFDLGFDYGMYTAPAKDPDELIDSKKARIETKFIERDVGSIHYTTYHGVNFEDIGRPGVNLGMFVYGKSSADEEVAKTIFRSIRFD